MNNFILNVYVTMVTISCINVCAVKAQRNAFNLAQNRPTISATILNISIFNKLHLNMPVLEESHLGDFGAPILCTSGLCGMFLLMFK